MMSYRKFAALLLILFTGCTNRSIDWVSLGATKDYDIVQYDSHRRIVWATNNYEDHIVAVVVDANGALVRSMLVVNLPAGEKSVSLCVSDLVWVVTGDNVLRYMSDTEEWNTDLQLDLDDVSYCKTLPDETILFFGRKKHTKFLAKYQTVEFCLLYGIAARLEGCHPG